MSPTGLLICKGPKTPSSRDGWLIPICGKRTQLTKCKQGVRNRAVGGIQVQTQLCPGGGEIPERKEIRFAAERGRHRRGRRQIYHNISQGREEAGSETRKGVQGRKDSGACQELPFGLTMQRESSRRGDPPSYCGPPPCPPYCSL